MEVRLAIGAHAVLLDVSSGSVTDLCAELGVSRDTYYRYLARLREGGLEGLVPRSRRPRRSPGATDPETVATIIAKHDELVAGGWDGGARSVHDWLTLDGVPVPSARTCHRILAEHGRTEPTPAKRPKCTYRRFEAMTPNGVWQLDGHRVRLQSGTAVVLRFQDDHSRMLMASRAAPGETSLEAWKCLLTAMDRHGKPAIIQCDNGTAFTARLTRGGGYADFEAKAHRIGIGMINSRPGHPQTNGKKEREWQTLDRWLAARPAAKNLSELQRLLEAYDLIFNTRRPHQGIGSIPPAHRYTATDKAVPDPDALSQRQFLHTVTLGPAGYFDLPGVRIHFGARWGGATISYLIDLDDAVLFHGDQILARVHLDTSRATAPPGKRAYHRVAQPQP
ncbi:MAG TPA: integrase core domain-containing protein [Nocardioides sp.]|nr:integrase core domain-containing protein [Nocardioides sp.]